MLPTASVASKSLSVMYGRRGRPRCGEFHFSSAWIALAMLNCHALALGMGNGAMFNLCRSTSARKSGDDWSGRHGRRCRQVLSCLVVGVLEKIVNGQLGFLVFAALAVITYSD